MRQESDKDCNTHLVDCEKQWFQIALKTFFWAGALNAAFCAAGLHALYEVSRIRSDAEKINRQNLKDMEAWREARYEARQWRSEADFAWRKVHEQIRELQRVSEESLE